MKKLEIKLSINGKVLSIYHIPVENPDFKLNEDSLKKDFKEFLSDFFMTEIY